MDTDLNIKPPIVIALVLKILICSVDVIVTKSSSAAVNVKRLSTKSLRIPNEVHVLRQDPVRTYSSA